MRGQINADWRNVKIFSKAVAILQHRAVGRFAWFARPPSRRAITALGRWRGSFAA